MGRYYTDDFYMDEAGIEAPVNPAPGKPANPQDLPGNLPKQPPTDAGFITVLPGARGGKRYICHIDFFVEEANPYYELMKILTEATEQDDVEINIYTYGGMVMTGCHIITAMYNSKAQVTTTAYGLCASIGAMIWAAGKIRKVTDNATIMFHMPSGGSFGKCADNEERNRNVQNYFKWFMQHLAKGILSPEEFEKVVTRRNDIFLSAKTIRERLTAIEMSNKQPVDTAPAPDANPEPNQAQQQPDQQPSTEPTQSEQPIQPEAPVQPAVEGNNE